MTSSIPSQLTDRPQWVTWNHEHRGGKPTKVPYIAGKNQRASAVDPNTWCDYETANADRTKSGVGFVFTADDPYVGIDLDDCLQDGKLKPWAAEIVAMLPATYTEVSPSGNGLKLWVSGELPAGGRNRRHIGDGQIEMYARGRYFTVTGERFGDSPLRVERADLAELHRKLFPSSASSAPVAQPDTGDGYDGSDDAMIQAIRRCQNGDKFAALFDKGNPEGGDHSNSDLRLCNILAFWCGGKADRIDRVFRRSALYREKWDRDDYRDRTITAAIEGQTSFYRPASRVSVNADSTVHARAANQMPYSMTDLGNAERLTEHFKGRVRFSQRGGGWYTWTGKQWRRDDTGQIVFMATRCVREIGAEARALTDEDQRKAMYKHAAKSEAQSRIAAMVKLAQSMPGVAVDSDDFDADPWLFNCSNGVIDLRTGELGPHDGKHNITKISPAGYHPGAQSPLWHAFLDRIFEGNVEMIDYVQELLGMSLSGDISEQVMPVFYGHGSNGKSTLLDTVMAVMGGYAGKAAPDLLMARQGDVHPTEIADLWGLRLAVASETEEGRKLRVSTVKEMTGDADLKARYMRGDFFNFRRTHKLVMMTNNRPRITESGHAIWRRLKLVPFKAQIQDHERDKNLAEKLWAERAGILAWLVRGCRRWHEAGGLDDPAEVREATQAYREDEDPLVEFVAECLELGDGFASNHEVRAAYVAWCGREGVRSPLGDRALLSKLRERPGVSATRRAAGRGLSGIFIKSS